MQGEYEFDELTSNNEFEDEPYDNIHGLLHDAFRKRNTSNMLEENEIPHVDTGLEEPNDEANFFFNFLKDVEKELYLG